MTRHLRYMLAAAGLLLAAVMPVAAATLDVAPGSLAAALARAAPGDTLRLLAGRHVGNFVITTPLHLVGDEGAVLDGEGRGRVLTLDAPGARVTRLVVTGSGLRLDREDAGIFLTARARGAMVEDSRILDTLIGIDVKGAADAVVRRNSIVGRTDLRVNERGNGIQVWNAPGTVVEANSIRHGRDGIFVTTSKNNLFANNMFRDVRYAIHYMYTEDSEIVGNRSFGNDVGYALMYSRRLEVVDNLSSGDRDHGFMLNYVLYSDIRGNRAIGAEKCVFMYNANINRFSGNRFEGCATGIHFTAGSERNTITGNAFVGNRNQVKYVGTRSLDWSSEGRGNYWSDDPNFDLDGDGIGDRPYRPNDIVDRLVWAHPESMLLLKSPAIELLRGLQSRLPALMPGGVVDSAPLMRPPESAP